MAALFPPNMPQIRPEDALPLAKRAWRDHTDGTPLTDAQIKLLLRLVVKYAEDLLALGHQGGDPIGGD